MALLRNRSLGRRLPVISVRYQTAGYVTVRLLSQPAGRDVASELTQLLATPCVLEDDDELRVMVAGWGSLRYVWEAGHPQVEVVLRLLTADPEPALDLGMLEAGLSELGLQR